MVLLTGFDPVSVAYKATALPLSYSRLYPLPHKDSFHVNHNIIQIESEDVEQGGGLPGGSRTLNPLGHLSLNQMCIPVPPQADI